MKKEKLKINQIPAIIYGEPSKCGYLFIHGKGGNKEEAERFAGFASKKGYQVLSIDLPGYGERKEEIADFVPWKVVPELHMVMDYSKQKWDSISLRATSFGAFCSLLAFPKEDLKNALFVSPVVDMEKLIQDMMLWAGITEEVLKEKKLFPTNFGETLDWQYYQYVKEHRIQNWNHPTQILYAGKDNLTAPDTMNAFAQKHGCNLTVMEDGEHWFHTQEQLLVMDNWDKKYI